MRNALIIVAAVVAILVAAGALIYNATDSRTLAAPTPPALTTSAPPPTEPPAPPSGSGPAPVILNPSIPGWIPVQSVKRAAVYDVPPDWKVFSENTIAGFETPDGKFRAAGSGGSDFGENSCGGRNNSLALAVTQHDKGSDIVGIGTLFARGFADAAYRDDNDRSPAITVGPPERITTKAGQQAVIVKTVATPASVTSACKIQRGAVYTITATGYRGEYGPTVSLVVVADEQITGAQPVPEAQIRDILSTLRLAP